MSEKEIKLEIDLLELERIVQEQKNRDEAQRGDQPLLCLGCLQHLIKSYNNSSDENSWADYIKNNRYIEISEFCIDKQCLNTCQTYRKAISIRRDRFSGRIMRDVV